MADDASDLQRATCARALWEQPAEPQDAQLAVKEAKVARIHRGCVELSVNTFGNFPWVISLEQAGTLLTARFLTALNQWAGGSATSSWQPLDSTIFERLQAVGEGAGAASYAWHGLLRGGGRIRLCLAILSTIGFSRGLLRDCMRHAPTPQSCTVVGAAASASATGPAPPGAPALRYPQGARDTCLSSSLASALHDAGEPQLASAVDALGLRMLTLPRSTKRVSWLRQELFNVLPRQRFTVRKLLQPFDPLCADAAKDGGVQIVVMQLVDSLDSMAHAVTACGPLLYDPNQLHGVPRTPAGLNACCLDGAHFADVHDGIIIVRSSETAASSSAAGRGAKRSPTAPLLHECFSCKRELPGDAFTSSQMKKRTRRCCRECTDADGSG
jgi:hypothetical protein